MYFRFSSSNLFLVILTILLIIISVYIHNYTNTHQEVPIATSDYYYLTADDIVPVQYYIPSLVIDLKYATSDNICGKRIYEISGCYLRKGTVEKLNKAQQIFLLDGYSIKIWDAYRTPESQFALWEAMPDSRFVINPYKGFSYHSMGVAVDITLVDLNGREIEMPTKFDDFTSLADRDYSDVSKEQAQNAQYLERVMLQCGFKSIFYEWWHFIDNEKDSYGVVYLKNNILKNKINKYLK